MAPPAERIESFNLSEGRVLAGKYRVDGFLGSGWEGEVYRVTEVRTGIPRAAKVFFPQRNVKDRAVRFYARKLEKLRKCPIVVQYHHSEAFQHRGTRITCLISELVEGELLEDFIRRQPGRRLEPFAALHLLHVLASGVEQIHRAREYHGDIHEGNVLVERRGIRFDLKLMDFYHWGRPDRGNIQHDVVQLVRLLYEAVGGRRRYASQPPQIKAVCCGLRSSLINRKFPTAGHLRHFLETFPWD